MTQLPKPHGLPVEPRLEIKGYTVLRPIGRGGMSTVYLAVQQSLDRKVAIKVLNREYIDNPDILRRFEAESEALARLDNPHIVAIIDRGMLRKHPYFVMEYIDGPSLADVRKTGTLTVGRLVQVIESVAGALAAAHRAGIVHRDVKPSNILVPDNGLIKLTDFGIAMFISLSAEQRDLSETDRDLAIGTAWYMPPEQARDASTASTRSDIYSFAATLYEMVCGEPPTHNFGPPSRASRLATLKFDRTIVRALDHDPAERQESVEEFAQQAIEGIARTWRRNPPARVVDATRPGGSPGWAPTWRRLLPYAIGIAVGTMLGWWLSR